MLILLLFPVFACVKGQTGRYIKAFDGNSDNAAIHGTLYRTVKRYHCSVPTLDEPELLLYDTRSWSYPAQDVSLNIEYPAKNSPYGDMEYRLSKVLVVFHLDGSHSAGFITSGGMMKEHINMKFIFNNSSGLSYDFYLYGVPSLLRNHTEMFAEVENMCG